jgi:hypothetical protein
MKRPLTPLTMLVVAALGLTEGAARAADPTTDDCRAASDASPKLGREHKLRAERAQLLVCAATSCPMAIRKECVRRLDEVNAQVPTIIFAARDASGADLSAVKITMDGEVLAERLDGSALSIDPGEHTFRFEAAGQPAVQQTLVIHEADKERRKQVVIGTASAVPFVPAPAAPVRAPTPVAAPPSPAIASSSSPALAADTGSSTSTWSTQKTIALVVGGTGVAGVAVGGIFEGIGASHWRSAKGESCLNCTQSQYKQAISDHDSAASAATVSTVAFIAGGALVAAGVVLWFTAPSGHEAPPPTAPRVVPEIGPGSGGFVVQEGF